MNLERRTKWRKPWCKGDLQKRYSRCNAIVTRYKQLVNDDNMSKQDAIAHIGQEWAAKKSLSSYAASLGKVGSKRSNLARSGDDNNGRPRSRQRLQQHTPTLQEIEARSARRFGAIRPANAVMAPRPQGPVLPYAPAMEGYGGSSVSDRLGGLGDTPAQSI